MKKRAILVLLLIVFAAMPALAKTTPAGETVGNVLFYITNSSDEEILVAQLPVSEMEEDMKAGLIDDTLHNNSILDRFVTTVHQEGQGFSVQEFIDYARAKSPVENLRNLPMSFSGDTSIRFWEIDQTGYDDLDTYTYAELYEVPRYNFPLLYEYWDYANQDYRDPAGLMTREQVADHIFAHGEPETVILTVRAFSQRYMVTDEKYGIDYNMENYWQSRGLLDNERTMRIMKPMTREELYGATPTAADTRYWVANILLDMKPAPNITSLGTVAEPIAVMFDHGDNYYVHLSCETDGATILYNHNFISPSYTPTSPYGGTPVIIPKSSFRSGTVTLTARAVKEGYSDAGVVTLRLESSGTEENPLIGMELSDVEEGIWYYDAVQYAMEKELFDLTGRNEFSPETTMTRAMLAVALYRLEGSPPITAFVDFSDVTRGTPLSAAVSWCNAAEIVLGYPDGSFGAEQKITREQIATMIYRYAVHKQAVDVGSGQLVEEGGLTLFSDADSISDYALEAMAWAVGQRIINGMGDGTVAPQGNATRAQSAQILYNLRFRI